jgi:hypothetical protein
VFFLGTAMLVVVIGLSALAAIRVQNHSDQRVNDRTLAASYARSAIAQAILRIYRKSDWRKTSHDAWQSKEIIGDGWFYWKFVDEVNGDLKVDLNAPVRVFGQGACGDAVRVYSVLVQPPLERAPANIFVNGDLESGGASPWVTYAGCIFQLSTTIKREGTTALLVTGRSAGSGAAQFFTSLNPNITLRCSVWVRTLSATDTIWCGLWVQTEAGFQYFELARADVGRTWTHLKGAVAPSWTGSLAQAFWVVGADGTEDFYFDDARLYAAPTSLGPVPGTWRREAQ